MRKRDAGSARRVQIANCLKHRHFIHSAAYRENYQVKFRQALAYVLISSGVNFIDTVDMRQTLPESPFMKGTDDQ